MQDPVPGVLRGNRAGAVLTKASPFAQADDDPDA